MDHNSKFCGYKEKVEGNSLDKPELKYYGNKRHFFGKPKNDLADLIHDAKSKKLKNTQG